MRVPRFFGPLLTLFVAIFLLVGCDSGSEDDTPEAPAQSVFSFTLTENGTSTDFDGSANWTEGTSSGGEQAFGIIFNTPDQTTSGLLTREGSAPSSGSYSIASLQSAALVPLTDFSFYIVTDAAGDNLPTTYLSTGGSLAINSASSNSIAGSFNLNLVRFEIVNGQQQEIPATLNGTFTASQVTTIGIID